MRPHLVSAVAVVVPARDEEELLPACLAAVERAVAALHADHPVLPCRVFVVLDTCRDGSAEVVARWPGVTAVTVDAGAVGVARAAGVETAATWAVRTGDQPGLWIASTDADSTVPPHWLTTQVELAAAGHDLVVGTVRPREDDLDPRTLAAWHERHGTADGHPHVHGANLGFSLAGYRLAGGFAALPAHEDVGLVEAMRRAGLATRATGAVAVTTSGRRTGRAPSGFAGYLDGLRA